MSNSISQSIRAQVTQAIDAEQQNFHMRDYAWAAYQRSSYRQYQMQPDAVFAHLFQYIRNVPDLLEAFEFGAGRQGKSAEIQPFLQQVARYFYNQQDYLPDHYGLFGLLDDAFYACKTVELYENALRQRTGQVLVGDYDLPGRNQFAAAILGHDVAGRITTDVQGQFSATNSDNTMETLGALLLGGLVVGALFNQFSGGGGGGGSSSSSGWWEDDMASGMAEIQANLNRRR